jgi:pSer/pThr/pTyr-binding forkhead associated (FHA) protein
MATEAGITVRINGRHQTFGPGRDVTVGRDEGADVRSENGWVSRKHIVLRLEGSAWVVHDVGSTRGTYHEGNRVSRLPITGPVTLYLGPPPDGQEIQLTPSLAGGSATTPQPTEVDISPGAGVTPRVSAWVTVRSGPDAGKRAPVSGTELLIGRDPSCQLVLSDPKISRTHARVRVLPGDRVVIEDAGSRYGTLVNGRSASEQVALSDQDEIRIGDSVLTLAASRPRSVQRISQISGFSTLKRKVARSSRRAIIISSIGGLALLTATALILTGVLAPTEEEQPSVPDLVRAAKPSTVFVLTGQGASPLGSGSGWVLDAQEGLIITNFHVVEGGDNFLVAGGISERPASLVAAAPCHDLAVLQVANTAGLRTMPLGSQSDLRQGDTVIALGYPGTVADPEVELVTTQGVVSVVRTEAGPYENLTQTDAAINPGNSGGPLIDTSGKLVGVNSVGARALIEESGELNVPQNENYAISVDLVKEVAPVLRTGQSPC